MIVSGGAIFFNAMCEDRAFYVYNEEKIMHRNTSEFANGKQFRTLQSLFRPPGSKLESGGDDPFCDTKEKLPSPVRISCSRQVPGGTLPLQDPSLVS